jgi:hypothetical protein
MIVDPTRQLLKNSIFGATSAEINALPRIITTVATRIARRHIANKYQFKRSQEILHSEEEEANSPLTSDGEDESRIEPDDPSPIPAEDARSPWISSLQTSSAQELQLQTHPGWRVLRGWLSLNLMAFPKGLPSHSQFSVVAALRWLPRLPLPVAFPLRRLINQMLRSSSSR